MSEKNEKLGSEENRLEQENSNSGNSSSNKSLSQSNFKYQSSQNTDNYRTTHSNLDEVGGDDDDDDDGESKSFRQKLSQLLEGNLRKFLEALSFAFSSFSFIAFIISTYFPEEKFKWYKWNLFIVCTYFNLETVINLYLAQHPLNFILSSDTIVDLLSSILSYFALMDNETGKKISEVGIAFFIMRITKFIKKNIKMSDNEVARHIAIMVLSLLNLIILITCFFRIAEVDEINYFIENPSIKESSLTSHSQFHDFLYYVIISLSTVGYGDIYPITEIGRIVIIILIFLTAYLVPKMTNELITLLENSSIYARDVYVSTLEIPHLVICGNVGVDALRTFCDELFHADHGQSDKKAVILNQNMPRQEMRLFIHAGEYELNLKYLMGDPILDKDLDRADVVNAKCSVIMTDKFTDDPHSIDHKNILMALAIKKYFLQKEVYDSSLFIQLIKPENKIHYQSGVQSLSKGKGCSNDQIIIIEEIKMNLLSKSCLIPGIIPMITNLVRSSGSCDETEFTWLNEYLEGTGNEIYRASLNEVFKNNTFCQISQIIYEKYDAIAFALEIEIEGKTMISLNPGSFFIEKFIDARDDVKFYIYLICSDKEVADHIELADSTEDEEDDKDGKGDENNKESSNENANHIKNESKFKDYMRIKIEDIQQLDDNNDISNEPAEEEDDYFIIKNFVNNNVDVKKDSIRNSTIYRHHIVVCGTHPSLYYYILPLRARYLGRENLKYIVILTQDMPKDLWDSISRFENIILINGSPLNNEDLFRANIEYADKAVILESESLKNSTFDNQMIDSETVFVYKAIKKCNPNIQIMTELVFDSNIEFLLPNDELQKLGDKTIGYESTSVFSAGEVYVSSIIDTLTCQAYYNKHIVTIIHQLLTGGKNGANSALRSICENVGLKSSNLWQMGIPEKFINKTFIDLYKEFCEKNLIALGLYRLHGARDNPNPYIYTKPSPNTRLTHRDKIFVLGIDNINNYHFENDDGTRCENNTPNKENLQFDKEYKMEMRDILNEEYNQNSKFSPFKYVDDMLDEVQKQVRNLSFLLESTKTSIKESVSNGIKQEITSILH